jgi:hypothetical protein
MDATRFVLDHLRHGPRRLDAMCDTGWRERGLTREQVVSAASRVGVTCRKRTMDDVWFAFLPDNLSAIWWSNRPHAHSFGHAA